MDIGLQLFALQVQLLGFSHRRLGNLVANLIQLSLQLIHQFGELLFTRHVHGRGNVCLFLKDSQSSGSFFTKMSLQLNANAFHVHITFHLLHTVLVVVE